MVDPIGAFLSEQTDSHKNASVRRALAPLAELADREQTAIAVVGHLNKNEAQKLVARISGSGAFGEAARSVLAFARHPEDPDGDKGLERVIVHAKSNWGRYAPTLTARVEGRLVVLTNGDRADVGFLVITGESDIGPDDLLSTRDGDERAELTEAMAWLEDELADGEWHESRPVKEAAKAAGIAIRTLQYACEKLDIEHTREGLGRGRSAWRFQTSDDLAPAPLARDHGARSEPAASRAVERNTSPDLRSRATSRDVARDREQAAGDPDRLAVQLDARHVPEQQIEDFIAGCMEAFGATDVLVAEEPPA